MGASPRKLDDGTKSASEGCSKLNSASCLDNAIDQTQIASVHPKSVKDSTASYSVKKVDEGDAMVEKENRTKESDHRSKRYASLRVKKDRSRVEEPFKYVSHKERLLKSLEEAPPTPPPVDFLKSKDQKLRSSRERTLKRVTNEAQTNLAGVTNEITFIDVKKVDEVIQAEIPRRPRVSVNTQTSFITVVKSSGDYCVSSSKSASLLGKRHSDDRLSTSGDSSDGVEKPAVCALHAQVTTTRRRSKNEKCVKCHRSVVPDDYSTRARHSGSTSRTEFSLLSPVDSIALSELSGRTSRSTRWKRQEKFREMEELGLGFVRNGKWVPTDIISRTIWTKIEKCTANCQASWGHNSQSFKRGSKRKD